MKRNYLFISLAIFILFFLSSLVVSDVYHSLKRSKSEVKAVADSKPTPTTNPSPTYTPSKEDLEFIELQKKIRNPLNENIAPSLYVLDTPTPINIVHTCIFIEGSKCGDQIETANNCADIVCCPIGNDKYQILTDSECNIKIKENKDKYEELKKQYELEQAEKVRQRNILINNCVQERTTSVWGESPGDIKAQARLECEKLY